MRHLPGPVFVFLVDEPGLRLRGYYGYPGLPFRPYRTAIPSVVVRTAPRVTEAEAIERGWISPLPRRAQTPLVPAPPRAAEEGARALAGSSCTPPVYVPCGCFGPGGPLGAA